MTAKTAWSEGGHDCKTCREAHRAGLDRQALQKRIQPKRRGRMAAMTASTSDTERSAGCLGETVRTRAAAEDVLGSLRDWTVAGGVG